MAWDESSGKARGSTVHRAEDGDREDYRSVRRGGSGDWVRWAVLALLGITNPSFGFVVQLSNRMTAVEVKEDVAQSQRADLSQNLRDLSVQVNQLRETIITLNTQLESSRVPTARSSRRAVPVFPSPGLSVFDK
jgi:uncharacterized protein YlxW (UPF0749 family)